MKFDDSHMLICNRLFSREYFHCDDAPYSAEGYVSCCWFCAWLEDDCGGFCGFELDRCGHSQVVWA